MEAIKNNPNIQKKIELRISEIKKLRYFQNDSNELGLSPSDVKKGEVNLGTKFNISDKDNSITFFIKSSFSVKKDEKIIELFGIETSHKFEIKNLNKIFYDTINKKYEMPDNIIHFLLDISISGTRGMLVALCSNAEYYQIILPIIDTTDLLKKIKK